MSQDINLKQIERKAWTSYFQDGLWDIFFGLLLLTMGIQGLIYNVWFTFVIGAAVLVVLLGKKFITIPRIGKVKFGLKREVRQMKSIAVVGILVLAILIVLMLTLLGLDLPATGKGIRVAIQAVGFTVVFGLIAYFMDFRRLYAYGLFFAIGSVLSELFDDPIGPIAFSVAGSIALLIGLVLLARFLRKYPKAVEEGFDDNP